MNQDVIITCAAETGAAAVHVHARAPETGVPSHDSRGCRAHQGDRDGPVGCLERLPHVEELLLNMVSNGEATARETDLSVTERPGRRWAVMGPMPAFALTGGEGGMAHMLDHFGPSLKSPWTRLEAPGLDTALHGAVVAGCDDVAEHRTIADLVGEQDRGVMDVLRATRRLPGTGAE